MPTTYAIPNGRTVMDASLYTGNNTTNVISNVDLGTSGFKPDLIWIKGRSNTGQNTLQDSVRGANKYVISNSTAVEGTDGSVTSFNTNGFNLTADLGVSYNASGVSYVAWQWQAGQGSNTTNTSGTITSTISANVTAGFSIVTYTGNGITGTQTVGHGLGVAPKLVLVKNRSEVVPFTWYYSFKDGSWDYLFLNSTGTGGNADEAAPNSTTFNLAANSGGLPYLNNNGSNYVAYCWAQIPGFSQFGNYVGNGSNDGPFIYTGFRPKFVLIKQTSYTTDWDLGDSVRSPYNQASATLYPNSSGAETTIYDLRDYLSNGFKIRTSDGNTNTNGNTYIYMAFAENPFKYANAR